MCHPGQEGYGEDLSLLERCQKLVQENPYRLSTFMDIN
jgi:hypothetical protein